MMSVVALLLLGGLCGLTFSLEARGAVRACPAAATADPGLAGALWSLFGATPKGSALLARPPWATIRATRLCFVERGARDVLREDGVALLDARHDPRAAAARLAHLLVHRLDELTSSPKAGACEAWVARRLRSEVTAHRLEAELRRVFGLPAERPFERRYWRAKATQRTAALRRWLREPGGLRAQYRARCRPGR